MAMKIFTGVLAALIILITGCDNELMDHHQDQGHTLLVHLDRETAKEAYLATKENDTGPQTYDKILADIALEIPGYGGHFIDKEGALNVYLLDDQEREVFNKAKS